MAETGDTTSKHKQIAVGHTLVVPPGMQTLYADQFIVTSTAQGEVVISFFQTQHPVEEPAEGERVPSICTSRTICNFQLTKNLAQALINTLLERGVQLQILPPIDAPAAEK